MKYQTKKRFGQHFLHDPSVIHHLIQAIAPQPHDLMVEIGPGLGALSKPLFDYLQHLHLVEIDRDVIAWWQKQIHVLEKFTLHDYDALKFDFSQLIKKTAEDSLKQPRTLRVVGNLPYNISTPLLFHLLTQKDDIIDMHFMLQKEVVDRLTADVGSKDYGRLSVMAQYHCQTDYLFFVPPEAFSPPPKVDSAVVRLIPWESATQPHGVVNDEAVLANIVQTAFSKRRKTLRNALKDQVSVMQMEQAEVDPTLRPEMLSVSDFVRLANTVV
ncbi:MAG: 16S rRNA (adenine(1518)-N(6)/adenine(1519)-N(6))-dimethyltransferase RsmA [bacterium]